MLNGTMELLEEDLREVGTLSDAQEQVESARGELRRLSVLATELLDLSRLDADIQLRNEPVELGEIAPRCRGRVLLARRRSRRRARDRLPRPRPGARRPRGLRAGRPHPDRQRAALRAAREPIEISARPPRRPASPCGSPTAGRRSARRSASTSSSVSTAARRRSTETGFGLGLAIGRELAERMNGTLELADTDDRGACFVLTLPASASSPSPSPAPDSAAAA